MLVSPQAVAENPSIAATLSPAVLVNSLIAAGETEHDLESRIASLSAELTAVRAQLEQVERERAGERGRLSTLDEVIAALHGNLEDLREERRYWSRLPAPAEASPPRLESGEKLADTCRLSKTVPNVADEGRLVSLPADVRERYARQVEALRADATARYTEVDLLVAAFREHIDDLRSERDFLRGELERLHTENHELRAAAVPSWLWRGVKPPRTR